MNGRLFSVIGGAFLLAVIGASAVRQTAQAVQAGATISGKIKFTGTKPTNPRIDMSEEAACKAKYPAPPTAETVIVNANGTLANVFVYVKAGLPAGATYPAPTTPVMLDQNGCRYHPHVLGIQVGQPLNIKNSDPLLHNIKAKAVKNRPFNVPEVMIPLECNVHGWMNAFLGVLPHPFYAVSGSDGSFSIKGLPPGTYTIEAWHEKYGTQTATVTVAGAAPKTQDFTFAAH